MNGATHVHGLHQGEVLLLLLLLGWPSAVGGGFVSLAALFHLACVLSVSAVSKLCRRATRLAATVRHVSAHSLVRVYPVPFPKRVIRTSMVFVLRASCSKK